MERYFPFCTDSSSSLMEPNGTGGGGPSSYHHHHHHNPQLQPPTLQRSTAASVSPPLNGTQPNAADRSPILVFAPPVSGAGAVSAPHDPTRKKRGRPSKYASPEYAGTRSPSAPFPPDFLSPSSSPKKREQLSVGNAGQSFTPHIIDVSAGEDVSQKIMMFMQQCKRELCILSASGSITNASLGQPATSGGSVTVEGLFEILSLSGSYVHTATGGRTGGLSVCLSNPNGQIFGGVVSGPLKAAGPVQVILGTFPIDPLKDSDGSVFKTNAPLAKLPLRVGGASISSPGFQTTSEASGRGLMRAADDLQGVGRNPFAVQSQGLQTARPQAAGWIGLDAGVGSNDMTGGGHEGQGSPENGSYG